MFRHHSHHCEEHFERGGFSSEGRHWGGRRHWGAGRYAARLFQHGDLRFVILQLVAEKPRYGYEIIKAIEEQLGGVYTPSAGVVYPTLTMLEEMGYATVSATEGGKKLYTITPEGSAILEQNRAAVDEIFGRIRQAGEAFAGGAAPQILRAMENLRYALRLKLQKGKLSDEQVKTITGILDNAARDVEQL
jgi:DNA-binding PadR family transcriptional regulator